MPSPLSARAALRLLVIGGFSTYHLLASIDTIVPDTPLTAAVDDVFFWPARWSMFTEAGKLVTVIAVEGLSASGWGPLRLEEHYPARWESGYRWERPAVWKDRHNSRVLLRASCESAPLLRTRLVRERWQKEPGVAWPKERHSREVVAELACVEVL